jgi:hypothetical protein
LRGLQTIVIRLKFEFEQNHTKRLLKNG